MASAPWLRGFEDFSSVKIRSKGQSGKLGSCQSAIASITKQSRTAPCSQEYIQVSSKACTGDQIVTS
ncbi:hypothetical protein GJ496_003781 [Pomphorhynchus laevis]|nr:hypothetical protein GJ496_003781 [Pomphorhynchus laevis]